MDDFNDTKQLTTQREVGSTLSFDILRQGVELTIASWSSKTIRRINTMTNDLSEP